jgi:hypothetical protein
MGLSDLFSDWTLSGAPEGWGWQDYSLYPDPGFTVDAATGAPMTETASIGINGQINPAYLAQMSEPTMIFTDTSMAGGDPFSIRTSDPADPFGFKSGPSSVGGGGSGLRDALNNLAQAGGSGGGGGAGNRFNFAMPSTSSPVADRISAVQTPPAQTGAIPAGAPPANDFRPAPFNTPLAQSPEDPRALARLLRAFGER